MMWWHDDGNGWAWLAMALSMAAFWSLAIWAVVRVVRSTRTTASLPTPAAPPLVDPERVLGERFARGEIDADEFEKRRELLRR